MYIATTGMIYNQKVTDSVSNNIANSDTTGFKRDVAVAESFPEVLLSKINDSSKSFVNHEPFSGVKVDDRERGVYSVSINSGYFKTGTPAGISHNRELKFVVSPDGYLRTFSKDTDENRQTVGENFVLDRSGNPIRVQNGENLRVLSNGNVLSNGQVAGNLVSFPPNSVIGTASGGIRLSRVAGDFSEGNYIKTENDLDFAISGNGFFKVADSEGNEYYTRDGAFTVNSEGILSTKDGLTVLGTNGPITVPSGRELGFSSDGTITVDGAAAGRLNVVVLDNKHELRKLGANLYKVEDGFLPKESVFEGTLLNGHLESSNVSAIKEMVQLITATRNYESNQKVITSHDELLSKVANELGRV